MRLAVKWLRFSTGAGPGTTRSAALRCALRCTGHRALSGVAAANGNNSTGKFRAAALQLWVGDDKPANIANARKQMEAAKQRGAEVLVLPEIWNGPYANASFPAYAERVPEPGTGAAAVDSSASPSCRMLSEAARDLQVTLIGGSISEFVDAPVDGAAAGAGTGAAAGPRAAMSSVASATSAPAPAGGHVRRYYNTCTVWDRTGALIAKHRKVHLFDVDMPGNFRFMESDVLSRGDKLTAFNTRTRALCSRYSPHCWFGVGICYDIRFPELALLTVNAPAAASTAAAGAAGAAGAGERCKVLCYPGAFNTTTGPLHWELLQRARAVDNQVFVITAAPARNPASSYAAWGHSTIVSPRGVVLATTGHDADIVVADIDLAEADYMRAAMPLHRQKRTDLYTVAAVPQPPPRK